MNPMSIHWEDKYRPPTIDECVLPKRTKETFQDEIKRVKEGGILSNFLFESTTPGTGKTTSARALCNEIDADVLFINASENGNVDQLRSEIRGFCSTISMTGSPKVVILDEVDNASDSFQKAFRGFIEEFMDNCSFILTCNYANKIEKAIRSRLKKYTFSIPQEEKKDILKQMAIRCLKILEAENIEVTDKKIIVELVKQHYPDNRSTIIALQDYSRSGKIDEGILGHLKCDDAVDELVAAIKEKNFKEVNNLIPRFANDYSNFIKTFYERCYTVVQPASIPTLIEIIGENQIHATSVPDMEIHLRYMCVLCMTEVMFK